MPHTLDGCTRQRASLLSRPRSAPPACSGVSATDGVWHHVTVTWRSSDGATNLYDNGRLVRGACRCRLPAAAAAELAGRPACLRHRCCCCCHRRLALQVWAVTRGQGKKIPQGGTLVIGREQDWCATRALQACFACSACTCKPPAAQHRLCCLCLVARAAASTRHLAPWATSHPQSGIGSMAGGWCLKLHRRHWRQQHGSARGLAAAALMCASSAVCVQPGLFRVD